MTEVRSWPRGHRWPLVLGFVLAAAAGSWLASGEAPPTAPDAGADATVLDLRPSGEQLARGRDLYDFHCTTCHGASGAGFAEARAAFPADHYDCFRCHGRRNPPTMTRHQIETSQTVFSLGEPPPLRDRHVLSRYGTAAALLDHVSSTMPRWDPGRLADDEYLDVTLYVLSLAYEEISAGDERLTAEQLRHVRLVGTR